jgi:hypothetical protein
MCVLGKSKGGLGGWGYFHRLLSNVSNHVTVLTNIIGMACTVNAYCNI